MDPSGWQCKSLIKASLDIISDGRYRQVVSAALSAPTYSERGVDNGITKRLHGALLLQQCLLVQVK